MCTKATPTRTCFSKAVRLGLSTGSSLISSTTVDLGTVSVPRFLDFDFDNSDTRCSVIATVVSATFCRSRPLLPTGSAGEAEPDGRLAKRLFSFNRLCEAARSRLLRALSLPFFGGEKYGLWTMWGSGVFSELVFVEVVVGDLSEPVACRLRGLEEAEVSVFPPG